MRILLCPDKFKGSLSSEEVCETLLKGILSTYPESKVIALPMADGGDGSAEIIKTRLNLKEIIVQTVGPLGRNLSATYYTSTDAAFIELASASGLILLKDHERNPLYTSTRGTGLMIKHALQSGYRKIYLFIGGSATNDGGIGIAQALGFDFLSNTEEQLEPIGINLGKIKSIRNNRLFDFADLELIVLCDVNNPMYGSNGAAHVYAKQKGAKAEEIIKLDHGLENYAAILKQKFSKDLGSMPGMGAAGAVGASLVGLIDAKLQNGFQMISDLTQLEMHIQNADLIITGEGKIDQSSYQGKVVGNVLALCKKHNKPCGIVGGIIDDQEENNTQFLFALSIISRAANLQIAMMASQKFLLGIGKEIGIFMQS